MSGVLFKGSSGPIATIVNYYSAGSVVSTNSLAANDTNNLKETLSGALTATVLSAALISITGRGRLNSLVAYTKDVTSRTVRLQVVVDGVTVFDATSSATTTSGAGLVAVGTMEGSTPSAQVFQPIDFNTSLSIKVASSITETNKVAIGANYETWT